MQLEDYVRNAMGNALFVILTYAQRLLSAYAMSVTLVPTEADASFVGLLVSLMHIIAPNVLD